MTSMNEKELMEKAVSLAKECLEEDEVPVGAVVVRNGEIVGEGRNRRERDKNALAHAEIEAINNACRTLGGWRLWKCKLYVTLEPCPMCAGAIVNARIPEVYFGARDPKAGACGSVLDMFGLPLNHHPSWSEGLLGEEAAALLREFFAGLRKGLRKANSRTCSEQE